VPLEEMFARYLMSHTRGRLATVAPDGTPQNKPVGYRYNAELGTIDIGGFNMETSAKYRNIRTSPQVSFVVDDAIGEGASGMRFVEVRGLAEQVAGAPPGEGEGQHLIRIHPRRVVSWNIAEGAPAFAAQDLDTTAPSGHDAGSARPALEVGGAAAGDAAAAAASLVQELQAGWDGRDADVSNRHFAADIVWGSPFGAVLQGYDDLHAIHVRLKSQGQGGPSSRFEVDQLRTPAPGVAIAQIRRVALAPDGFPFRPDDDHGGAFSEVALYVLIRRGTTWWVAAGQNTPVQLPG
jgi:PPOX class F420-dependent enzyme/OxyR family protein/uncharacterized protein (TIGR02246 family)